SSSRKNSSSSHTVTLEGIETLIARCREVAIFSRLSMSNDDQEASSRNGSKIALLAIAVVGVGGVLFLMRPGEPPKPQEVVQKAKPVEQPPPPPPPVQQPPPEEHKVELVQDKVINKDEMRAALLGGDKKKGIADMAAKAERDKQNAAS